MSIKIKSLIFSDKLLNKMKKDYHKSINLNKEIGFAICQKKNGDIIYRNHCVGRDCVLDSMRWECKKNEKLIGDFHTHPTSGSEASLADLSNTYQIGLSFIAGAEEIKCFLRRERYKYEHHKEIYDAYIKYQQPLSMNRTIELLEIFEYKTEEIINKYFIRLKVGSI